MPKILATSNNTGLEVGTEIYIAGAGGDIHNAKIENYQVYSGSLPSGYTELEYIETNGSEYINTGFYPNNNTQFKFRAYPLDYYNYGYLYSTDPTEDGCCCNYGVDYAFAFMYDRSWFGGQGTSVALPTDEFYVDKNFVYKNGELYAQTSSSSWNSYYSIHLFKMNYGAGNFGKYRLYYFTILSNGTKQMEFIPCYQNSDNVIGLYDTVNNVFYTNSGTGTFTAGPEVQYQTTIQPNTFVQIKNGTIIESIGQIDGITKTQCTQTTAGQVYVLDN